MPGKKVSVIIVSYNSESFIEKCVVSVLKFLPENGEVIILDNASTDQTASKIKKFAGQVKVLESAENLGFSKGNNKAVKEAGGEYLFFLNPDTIMSSSVIVELIKFSESDKNIGLVGPKLIMPDSRIQKSVIKSPSLKGAVREFIFGVKNAYLPYAPEGDQPVEVECLFGAAMLVKKDLFEKLEGFDEKFFLYYEDVDLCDRLRKMGKKIYYYPKVEVKHLVGGTKSDKKSDLMNQSARIYNGSIKNFLMQIIFRFAGHLKLR